MKREIVVISLIALCVAGIMWLVYSSSDNSGRRYAWWKTYEDSRKQPYDFGVFKGMLQGKSEKFVELDKNIFQTIEKERDASAYVFIGRKLYLNKEEIDTLLNFAKSGKQLVLISEVIPDTLLEALSGKDQAPSLEQIDESSVGYKSLNSHSEFDSFTCYNYSRGKRTSELTDWHYLKQAEKSGFYFGDWNNSPFLKLASINGKLCAVRFKLGKGSVLVHTVPMILTNQMMLNDTGYLIASELMSEVDLKHVVYDVFSREYKQDAAQFRQNTDSPLGYILKQKAFRWSWYIFLGSVLLFFVFRVKRTQRIIPVLAKKGNSTLSFIDTLSGLFYNNANHRQMANKKMQLFLFFIRNTFGITTHDISERTIELISLKSKVSEDKVSAIFKYYNGLSEKTISAEQLMELNNRISQFYQIYHSKKNQ